MMSSEMNDDRTARASQGCWTCRVRRKKCDNHRPMCHVCSALLITCHFGPEKPVWLDGGERQQEMAEELKLEVKNKMPYRRSLAYAKALDIPLPDVGADPNPSSDHSSISFEGISSTATSTSSLDPSSGGKKLHRGPEWASLDQGLIVCYLDFFFPFLFPFYQPSILDRGRTWVLEFITDSQAMEQTTLSLSSYFFSLSMETTQESGSSKCKQISWEKLLHEIHSTFSLLQEELRRFATEKTSKRLPRTVQIMGCILLLQRFETAVWSFENCQAHLNAAVELFTQMLEDFAVAADALPTLLDKFESITHQLQGQTFRSASSENMAFRFFSALLLVDDIVASTAIGQEPQLYQYHDSILGSGQGWADQENRAPIHLESIMGCQNWAMIAVAKVSALAAWKKKQRAAGDLDMTELVLHAATIKNMLTAHLTQVEASSHKVSANANHLWDIHTPCNGQIPALSGQSLLVTRIWAHAACLYLSIVVSGWQPTGSEIRHHVARILELLSQRLLSWAVLRTVAWPFCVAGCLAMPSQEHILRGVVEGLRPTTLLGPVKQALEVMENVWQHRDMLDVTSWDLEACFKQPDHTVLLVQ